MSSKTKEKPPKPRGKAWVWEYSLEELKRVFRQEKLINKNKLEKASLEQASLFEKWHSALEDVEADITNEQRQLDNLKNNLQIRVRNLFPDFKEAAVTAEINRNSAVKKKVWRIQLMNHYRGTLKGFIESSRQRKSMIQVLKDLYQSNYWDKTSPGGTKYGKEAQKHTT